MANIVGDFFGKASNQSADETIAWSSMSAAATASQAYLAATLEATTPEVRRLFSEYTTQSVMAHEAITALCIKKGWLNPTDPPTRQLEASFQQSQQVLGNVQ